MVNAVIELVSDLEHSGCQLSLLEQQKSYDYSTNLWMIREDVVFPSLSVLWLMSSILVADSLWGDSRLSFLVKGDIVAGYVTLRTLFPMNIHRVIDCWLIKHGNIIHICWTSHTQGKPGRECPESWRWV